MKNGTRLVTALAAAWLAGTPAVHAQCSVEVEHATLDAGTSGPRLTTPEGAAVVGGVYSVQVRDALPATLGVIAFGVNETQVYDPLTQATLFELPMRQFSDMADDIPQLKRNVRHISGNVLAHTMDTVFALGQKKAHERVCFFLRQLLERDSSAYPRPKVSTE